MNLENIEKAKALRKSSKLCVQIIRDSIKRRFFRLPTLQKIVRNCLKKADLSNTSIELKRTKFKEIMRTILKPPVGITVDVLVISFIEVIPTQSDSDRKNLIKSLTDYKTESSKLWRMKPTINGVLTDNSPFIKQKINEILLYLRNLSH